MVPKHSFVFGITRLGTIFVAGLSATGRAVNVWLVVSTVDFCT